MLVSKGKPSDMASGCAWGVLGAPVLFLGGGWTLGKIAALLTWIFG